MKPRPLVFLLALVLPAAVFSHDPQLIAPGAYAEAAQKEIDAAAQSVRVYLYLLGYQPAKPQSGPSRLADALIRAADRGVEVSVLLDAGQPFDEQEKNQRAARYLKDRGVAVAFVEGRALHAKALVVDKKTLLLGSSNWTTAAFENNAEADVLFRSTAAAAALISRMDALPRRALADIKPDGQLRLPAAFLMPPGKLGEMVRTGDAWALDLYLHLVHLGLSSEEFQTVDRPAALRAMGYAENTPAVDDVRLRRALGRLQRQYGLAEYKVEGPDTLARLKELPGPVFSLPREYFAHGWGRRLSIVGKQMLLLSTYHSALSPTYPAWSLPQRALADRHGTTQDAVNKGVVELRRHNLLEVQYDAQPTPADPARLANQYLPGPLYDPAENQKRLDRLAQAQGKAAVARARAIAEMLYEDNDVGMVEQLIDLEKQYGEKTVGEAAKLLGEKRPDNPKRNFGYLIGTVRGMAGNKP